jgi:Tfp pilus assembly protein PilX
MSRQGTKDVGLSRKRGIALLIALGAIVIVGALMVSMFYGASLRGRIGSAIEVRTRAMLAADFGESEALLAVSVPAMDSLGIGASTAPQVRDAPGGGSAIVTITRLQQDVLLLVTEGRAESPTSGSPSWRTALLCKIVRIAADSTDSTAASAVVVPVTKRAWVPLF